MQSFLSIDTEQIGADLSKVVERITKQYEDFPKAFQKEAIQNAWDARLDRKNATGWEVKIYTYEEAPRTHLIVEDFGTTGMNDQMWDAFLSLWRPEKEGLDAGGQGQGKFVLMGASTQNILIVESKSDEIDYRCKFLQNDQKSRGQHSISDFIPGAQPLSHKGTKVWVYDVKSSFLESLTTDDFIDSIVESWWQILESRFNANIYVCGKKILLPKLPGLKEERILLENKQLGQFGRIKRLVLHFYDEPLPKSFQGIRIQRANMMVTKIPFEVYEKAYQGRFSGFAEFDYQLEAELKEIERTDHCGFLNETPWKELKTLLRGEASKFVDQIVPKKPIQRLPLANLSAIVQKANQIISEHCPQLHGSGPLVPLIARKEKPPLRLGYLVINKREVKYGDIMKPTCKVINDTDEEKKCLLRVELKREGTKVSKEEYKFKVNAHDTRLVKLSEIGLGQEYPRGKYTLRATLQENGHDLDTKATSFYLEVKREPVKKGFVKEVRPIASDEPLRNKPLKDGIIEINFNHRDYLNIRDSFGKSAKQLGDQTAYYIIKICIDEAVNELYRQRFGSCKAEEIDDIILEISQLKDRMYYDVYS